MLPLQKIYLILAKCDNCVDTERLWNRETECEIVKSWEQKQIQASIQPRYPYNKPRAQRWNQWLTPRRFGRCTQRWLTIGPNVESVVGFQRCTHGCAIIGSTLGHYLLLSPMRQRCIDQTK